MSEQILESAARMANPDPEKEPAIFWTTAKLVQWVREKWGKTLSRETLRRYLKRLGFSWKKAKKVLNKANPEKRQEFLDKLEVFLKQATDEDLLLVYVDEAHKHPDTTLGYGWTRRQDRLWVASHCNQLSERTTLYGLYLYNEGQVRIGHYPTANQDHTQEMLARLRDEFPQKTIQLIWDGAPYHRARTVYQASGQLGISIEQLPAYSPDFMPVEELWSWMREELTDLHGFPNQKTFLKHIQQFQDRINQNPHALADRLWRTTTLDPNIEKLRISN